MDADIRCEKKAATQHWVLTSEQARSKGMTDRMIRYRVGTGAWKKVLPGIFMVGQAPVTWKTKLMAAILWAGPGSVASHTSAGALFGLMEPNGEIHVSSPKRRSSAHGVEMHHNALLPTRPRTYADGIPTTRIERVLIDLCKSRGERRAEEMIKHAVRQNRTSLSRLIIALSRHGSIDGSGVMRRILRRCFAVGITDSQAEDLFRKLSKEWCLKPKHHHVVRIGSDFVAELDFAFLEELVDVEIDGRKDHDNPVSEQADNRRDARLMGAGWLVVRATYGELISEPDRVMRDLVSTLRARRVMKVDIQSQLP